MVRQKQIAQTLGYSERHISRIFRRHCQPSPKLARKIEELTGIPWTSWFEAKEPYPPPPAREKESP